jgi:hypothetical protein
MLVDCGTTLEKEMQDLCYLVDDPVYKVEHLAVAASLYNVEPPYSLKSWPTHSIKKFTTLATEFDILAEFSNAQCSVRVNFCYVCHFFLIRFEFKFVEIFYAHSKNYPLSHLG